MKYKTFLIRGYKGITKEILIDLEKNSLIPLIGINECGKTTILEAIFAFDRFNDDSNNGRHLENIENMYSTIDNDIKVEAKVEFDYDELVGILDEVESSITEDPKKNSPKPLQIIQEKKLNSLKDYRIHFETQNLFSVNDSVELNIGRDLKTKNYYFIKQPDFINEELNHDIIFELARLLPYTLYFDDFRDRLDEKLEISNKKSSDWVSIIDKLFKLTNPNYSVFDIPKKNENIRRSIIAEVEIKLNEELLKEWPHFSIQQSTPLQIKINYSTEQEINYLEFLVIEKVLINNTEKERYFKIQDRSKGFFWYFNFIMKLIFNTKSRNFDNSETVYLLDEPGSYLHSTAQFRLTKRLKDISKRNKIIYCTHSPYLLAPTIIPLNSIKIVEKNSSGSIEVKSAFETKGKLNKKNSAYQPIYDSLDIRPILLDYDIDNIVLVEGIYDFLSFEMFKKSQSISFFPCVSADSILNNISYMIFLKKKYLALWDNDKEGLDQLKKAKKHFGEIESKKFNLLPLLPHKRKSRLENIYEKDDLLNYKTKFNLPANQSFEKTILHIFYSEKRSLLISNYFATTQRNFVAIISDLEKKLTADK